MFSMFKKLFSKSTKLNHKSHPIGTIVVIGFVGGKVSENSPSSKKVPYRGKDQIVMWSLCKKAVLFSSNNTWYSVDEIKVLGVISSESPYVNMTLTSSEPNNEIDPPSPISTIVESQPMQPKHKVNFDMNPSPGVRYPTKTVVDMDKLKEKDSELTKQLHEAISLLKEAQVDLDKAMKIK